ncbi:hypothetical protein Pelo_5974 [Pelomyxa schiedti]|nr:hypothetical protein Pelo_5974 [Pelomyxa schiedti]
MQYSPDLLGSYGAPPPLAPSAMTSPYILQPNALHSHNLLPLAQQQQNQQQQAGVAPHANSTSPPPPTSAIPSTSPPPASSPPYYRRPDSQGPNVYPLAFNAPPTVPTGPGASRSSLSNTAASTTTSTSTAITSPPTASAPTGPTGTVRGAPHGGRYKTRETPAKRHRAASLAATTGSSGAPGGAAELGGDGAGAGAGAAAVADAAGPPPVSSSGGGGGSHGRSAKQPITFESLPPITSLKTKSDITALQPEKIQCYLRHYNITPQSSKPDMKRQLRELLYKLGHPVLDDKTTMKTRNASLGAVTSLNASVSSPNSSSSTVPGLTTPPSGTSVSPTQQLLGIGADVSLESSHTDTKPVQIWRGWCGKCMTKRGRTALQCPLCRPCCIKKNGINKCEVHKWAMDGKRPMTRAFMNRYYTHMWAPNSIPDTAPDTPMIQCPQCHTAVSNVGSAPYIHMCDSHPERECWIEHIGKLEPIPTFEEAQQSHSSSVFNWTLNMVDELFSVNDAQLGQSCKLPPDTSREDRVRSIANKFKTLVDSVSNNRTTQECEFP